MPEVDGPLGVLVALLYGVLSALVPAFNTEAFVVLLANRHPTLWPLPLLAMTVGTVIGKSVIFVAARRGSEWLDRWSTRRNARAARRRARRGPRPESRWAARRRAWSAALLTQMDRPWVGGFVVLLSALVGIPPLALVAVVAGIRRTPFVAFAVAVLLGRAVRFAAIALPVALAS